MRLPECEEERSPLPADQQYAPCDHRQDHRHGLWNTDDAEAKKLVSERWVAAAVADCREKEAVRTVVPSSTAKPARPTLYLRIIHFPEITSLVKGTVRTCITAVAADVGRLAN